MPRHAVLFANLGSPGQPEAPEVRRYLNQFLMDPHVVQLPWILRRLIVSLFVLPKRPAASAEAYRSIWTSRGSPLVVLSMDLLERIREETDIPVAMAMRYGTPSIEAELTKLAANEGVEEILFIPMYPHYAESTVLTSIEEAKAAIAKHRLNVQLKVLPPFYDNEDYIDALVQSAAPYLEQPFDHVVFSYHGLPELHLKKADPTGAHCLRSRDCCSTPSPAHATCYRHQVLRTTEEFVKATGLREEQYTVAFQSRLGRARWLEPATEQVLRELAAQGVKHVLVLCPAFVTDCLETLEEIEIRGGEVFRETGGEKLTLVPCLNTDPRWVETLLKWIN